MNGFRREQTDPRSIQLNQGITESALDELLYRPRFSCQRLTIPAGSPLAFGNINSTVTLDYPAGTNNGARMTWPLPSSFLIAGPVTLRIWWAADTVNANTIQWQFGMSPNANGSVPTNLPNVVANIAYSGAVANVEQENLFTAANAINASHVTSGVNITRNGGVDTYPGIARLIAFQLIYTPAAGH